MNLMYIIYNFMTKEFAHSPMELCNLIQMIDTHSYMCVCSYESHKKAALSRWQSHWHRAVKYNIMKSKKAANENVMISSNYMAETATWLILLARSAEMPRTLCLHSSTLLNSPPDWKLNSPQLSMTIHDYCWSFLFPLSTSDCPL